MSISLDYMLWGISPLRGKTDDLINRSVRGRTFLTPLHAALTSGEKHVKMQSRVEFF